MRTNPVIEAMVTNINTAGQWIVITTITTRHGPFKDRAEAEAFKGKTEGSRCATD